MSGIPKGFVRLTLSTGLRFIAPASFVVAFESRRSMTSDPKTFVTEVGSRDEFEVRESFAEVQAALCKALGEQP